MPAIILQSSEGDSFEVDVEIANKSGVFKTMIEDLGVDEIDKEPIPLPNINTVVLKMVLKWCTHHRDEEDPPGDDEDYEREKRTDDISAWDQEFLKIKQKKLFNLILAANYLDIKGLLEVTCKTVANMIKNRTPDQVRKWFHIKNDFTPEEEEKIRQKNSWAAGTYPANDLSSENSGICFDS